MLAMANNSQSLRYVDFYLVTPTKWYRKQLIVTLQSLLSS